MRCAHLVEEFGGVEEVVGFAVEFNRFDRLVFVEKVFGVLRKKRVYLAQVVLLRKLDRAMPLVELHTRVHRLFCLVALRPITT